MQHPWDALELPWRVDSVGSNWIPLRKSGWMEKLGVLRASGRDDKMLNTSRASAVVMRCAQASPVAFFAWRDCSRLGFCPMRCDAI